MFAPSSVGNANCKQETNTLVKIPLQKFRKLTGKDGALTCHENSVYHKQCVSDAQFFRSRSLDTSLSIQNQLSTDRLEKVMTGIIMAVLNIDFIFFKAFDMCILLLYSMLLCYFSIRSILVNVFNTSKYI